MIECYYKWCKWHCKDEPFCNHPDNTCVATKEEIKEWQKLRDEYLREVFLNTI